MKASFPKSLKTGEKYCFKTMDTFVYDETGRTVADRLRALDNAVDANINRDTELSTRIDNIIRNDTSTENNTELIDIRTGHNGTVYASAGTAVREQINDVYDSIKEIIKHTREVVPRDMNIYDAMYKHDDETMLYTDYVKFPYMSTVYVPAGYQVAVYVYDYNETTFKYTEVDNSGWVTKYPIPKNKHVVIKLKHSDGSNILETESIALMFQEEYPELNKNANLNSVGFYDALDFATLDSAFSAIEISTQSYLKLDKVMFVKANAGYKCNVFYYGVLDDGSYSEFSGQHITWNNEQFIPANTYFKFEFAKEDNSFLTFEEFVENFTVEELQLDDEIMTRILNTVSAEGVFREDWEHPFYYGASMIRLASAPIVFDTPVTIYVDYAYKCSVAYHIPYEEDPKYVAYDSDWSKVITIPANKAVRVYFKHDTDTTNAINIKDLYTFKTTTGIVNENINSNIKDVAYRGAAEYGPENTIVAYKIARRQGFQYVHADIRFTSDGVAVLLHDETIDRTSNGSGAIASMTYNAARAYDFSYNTNSVGRHNFGGAYPNTKIPDFHEFIVLCKHLGLHPYLEIKAAETEFRIDALIGIVKDYSMINNVTWLSPVSANLMMIKNKLPNARLGYVKDNFTSTDITLVKSTGSNGLKNDTNEVFLTADYSTLTTAMLSLCITDNIPLEVYNVRSIDQANNIDTCISGVASTWIQVGKYLTGKYLN